MGSDRKIAKQSRRSFVKASVLGGVAAVFSRTTIASAAGYRLTPSEVEGPFYPLLPQKDRDFDLTRVAGKEVLQKAVSSL